MTDTQKQLPAPEPQQKAAQARTWPVWIISILALVLVVLLALWNWQQWNNSQADVQASQNSQQVAAVSIRQH